MNVNVPVDTMANTAKKVNTFKFYGKCFSMLTGSTNSSARGTCTDQSGGSAHSYGGNWHTR